MKQLEMNPLSLKLLNGGLGRRISFERRLKEMFDRYGFALLTDAPEPLIADTQTLKREGLPYFLDPRFEDEVIATWPLSKHGQLGPTREYEEQHLDAKTGDPREKGELKRYVSVDAQGNGWGADDITKRVIPRVFSGRYSIGMQVTRAYENGRNLRPGTLANVLSLDSETHTTGRVQWYPKGGYSLDHTDKCAITVLDFEPGLQIEYPQGSGEYVEIIGAQPGDLVINLGDTFSRMLHGHGVLSTRHRVLVPETCPPEGRIVFPVFIHTNTTATFPDGTNVWQWCVDEWAKESHVSERAA